MLTIVSQNVVTPSGGGEAYSPPEPPDAEVFNQFYDGKVNKSYRGTFSIDNQELSLSCDEFTVAIPLDNRQMRLLYDAMKNPGLSSGWDDSQVGGDESGPYPDADYFRVST